MVTFMEVVYILVLFIIFYKTYITTNSVDEALKIKGNPDFIHKKDVYVKLYTYLKSLKKITLEK